MYPAGLAWLAQAAVPAAAATFLGGRGVEIGFGALSGVLIGALWRAGRRWPRFRLLGDLLGAAAALLVAWLAILVRPEAGREIVMLAGVIVLVPGMTFTTGLAELANKNLVSGAARLMEAFVTFLSLVTGVGLVLALERFVGSPPPTAPPLPLPLAYQLVAVLVAGLSFGVVFSVPRKFVVTAVGSALVGWVSSRLLGGHGPAYLAAFVSSLSVCLYANALARVTAHPSQLFQLPGMMLLVPGSFGFISLSDMMRGDLEEGARRAIAMILVGGALVSGVLFANALLRPRKLL
jgi:uncharacterized membrane protein YjjB (DUF3815 family)